MKMLERKLTMRDYSPVDSFRILSLQFCGWCLLPSVVGIDSGCHGYCQNDGQQDCYWDYDTDDVVFSTRTVAATTAS